MPKLMRSEIEKRIDILEDDIADIDPRILRLLLKDKTSKGNILWCTQDYESYGTEYDEHKPMKVELITGELSSVIQPRAAKSKEIQRNRIRNRAEVFTPSWVCNEQNNLIDEAWFGRRNVFNTPHEKTWTTTAERIEFLHHYERKTKDSAYTFDEKTDAENDLKIKKLDKNGDYFIYFASIQDLRGSKLVGGNFNKNNAVFALNWDLIVIDEAHEGTQTELGDNVIKQLRKEKTKVLALSGTPFNLLNQFSEDNVYTWDYVMEQKKKTEWDLLHHGDHNPYADLPKMHIYTYDLGEKLKKYVSDEYDTKAFNFREFFRVWSRGPMGRRELPKGAVEGKFVHENDIISFLNLILSVQRA